MINKKHNNAVYFLLFHCMAGYFHCSAPYFTNTSMNSCSPWDLLLLCRVKTAKRNALELLYGFHRADTHRFLASVQWDDIKLNVISARVFEHGLLKGFTYQQQQIFRLEGIRFQLSKNIHPLSSYRFIQLDQLSVSQVLCIYKSRMSKTSSIFKHLAADWMLKVKHLFLR